MVKGFVRFFFEEDKGDGSGGAGTGDKKPDDKTQPPDPKAPKYNDDQLNDLIKKSTSKEVAKILEIAGVKTPEELAEKVKAAKTPPKTEDDPAKKELEELKKGIGELTSRADKNEAVAVAMKSGVTDEKKLEKAVKLALSPAYEGTVAERVAAVVAEVPEFVTAGGPTFGNPPKNDQQDLTQTVLDQALERAGVKVKK